MQQHDDAHCENAHHDVGAHREIGVGAYRREEAEHRAQDRECGRSAPGPGLPAGVGAAIQIHSPTAIALTAMTMATPAPRPVSTELSRSVSVSPEPRACSVPTFSADVFMAVRAATKPAIWTTAPKYIRQIAPTSGTGSSRSDPEAIDPACDGRPGIPEFMPESVAFADVPRSTRSRTSSGQAEFLPPDGTHQPSHGNRVLHAASFLARHVLAS